MKCTINFHASCTDENENNRTENASGGKSNLESLDHEATPRAITGFFTGRGLRDLDPDEADRRLNNYLDSPLKELPTIDGQTIKGFFVEKVALDPILTHRRFSKGLRIYLGLTNLKQLALMVVGVDKDGENILDDDCIIDEFDPCPRQCPNSGKDFKP